MKIVVIGGSGLIGKKLVNKLRQHGHEVVAASPHRVSTPSLARDWRKRSPALRWSSMSRMRLVGGQRSPGVFRDIRPEPPRRGSRRGRRTSCGAVGRRHRPPSGEWLLPRKDGPGKTYQGFLDSLHDRPRNAVLRVRGRHRPIGDRRTDGSASAGSDAAYCVG